MENKIIKPKVLKEYFSTEEKPVTGKELIDFRKADPKGFNELAIMAAKELEK